MRIAISGAGVAGPALAYWLLRTGHEPTLIEQAPHFRTGGYLIDFWGVGYTLAERMGILPQVLKAGYTVQEVRFVDAHGRRAGGFDTSAMRRMVGGRFTSLPRGDLAAQIYRTIEGRVEALFDNSITALDEHADGVRVDFTRGGQRDFDLVIGADGLHSTVRNITFGPQHQFERHLGYFVAAFEADGYRPRDELVYVSYGTPGRQISRFSLRGDRSDVSLRLPRRASDGPRAAQPGRAQDGAPSPVRRGGLGVRGRSSGPWSAPRRFTSTESVRS